MSKQFIPQLPAVIGVNAEDTVRQIERNWKLAAEDALKDQLCASTIAPYKTNGNVCGHKVLDDNAALEALIKSSPDHFKAILSTQEIKAFRKIQLMNGVLSKYWEVDRKTGKLTGNPSAAYTKRLERLALANSASKQAPVISEPSTSA